jgi:hypothetical protein
LVLTGFVTVLPLGFAMAATSSAKGQAIPEQVRAACKAEVAATNPPGTLSRKRNTREYLIAECLERRTGSAR